MTTTSIPTQPARSEALKRHIGALIAALTAISLGGCAGIPQQVETIGTSVSGHPIQVGRHAANNHSDLSYSMYNGRTRTLQGQKVPYLADALFDYPAYMVAWYVDNAGSSADSVGRVMDAPRSWQGDSLRFFAGTDAVLKLLGFGGAASMGWGQIGVSFLFSGMSEESTYRDRGMLAAREIAGSTLTLLRTRAALSSNELEEQSRLSTLEQIVENARKNVVTSASAHMVRYEAPPPFNSVVRVELPLGSTAPLPRIPRYHGSAYIWSKNALEARSWPLAAVPRHPLHRFQPQGTVETIAFRDIAYHPRNDEIKSPKELYERVVSHALTEDWYVLYTETDPVDNVRKVFVQQHRKDRVTARVVKFDIPASPFK